MSSQRHHKFRRCPLKDCEYFGGDLKRHLGSAKHKDEVDVNLIDTLVQIADKGKKTKGSNRLLMRWCPVEGCSFLSCYLRKHLKKKHGITSNEKLDGLRKKGVIYRPNQLPPSTTPSIEMESEEEEEEEEGERNREDGDNDRDQDYAPPGARSFFQTQRIVTDRHRLLVDFYDYLGTVDEGQKVEKIRFQHAYQMRKILEDIDPGGKDIRVLASEEGQVVWNLWIAPRLKNDSMKAGTLLSYLYSFSKFLKFLLKRQRRRQSLRSSSISEETCEIFRSIMEAIPGWRSTVLNERSVQRNEYYLKECEQRLTREDFRAFLKSPVVTEAESLFHCSKDDGERKRGVFWFSRARDYLIVRLAVSCGTRPRPLETATIDHFRQARRDSEFKQCFVMLVPRHKRQIDGPAIVTMDERLHEFVDIYIRDIRSTVVHSSEEKHLFVKVDGHPFLSGTIGARVTEFWRRSGVRSDLRVSCTDFRKGIVTMAEQANKEQRTKTGSSCVDDNDLRKLLCHSQQTAVLWYMREDLTALGARTHTALERIRQGELEEDGDEDGDGDGDGDRYGTGMRRKRRRVETRTGTGTDDGTGTGNAPETEAEAEPETDTEIEIETNQTDTGKETESRIGTMLVPLLPRPPVSSPLPPPQPLPLQTPPRERRNWSRDDSSLILQFVKSFKGTCPGVRAVYDEFYASPELKVILEREGIHRCVQKVRTTFKALRSRNDTNW